MSADPNTHSGDSLAQRFLRKLARAVCRHPAWFVWPQAALFVACIAYTFMRLEFHTSRDELVGAEKTYHRNFLSFKKEFPGQDDLVVIVESDRPDKNRQFIERLGARLEANGTKVARGSRALADERMVKDLIICQDPGGNRLEFFHGAAVASDPFKPGRNISGFRTGPLGMGHVVMHVERLADMMPFYQDVLEFRMSDYWLRPFPGYFFHVNPRHHSFAMMESGKNMVHHMMMELFSFDDVGQGYDLALQDDEKIAVTMGRHSGDYVTSFYTYNPSGFLVEYGWGGQVIDDATWKPFERKHGPSLWGHDRRWMTPAITQVQAERAAVSDVAHESFEAATIVKSLGIKPQ